MVDSVIEVDVEAHEEGAEVVPEVAVVLLEEDAVDQAQRVEPRPSL